MNSSPSSASSATRRKLLSLGGIGTLGGVAAYFGWSRSEVSPQVQASAMPSPVATPRPPAPVEALTEEAVSSPASGVFNRNAFIPHLRSDFTLVHPGDDSAVCRLLEVGPESRISTPKGDYISFTLLFEANSAFLPEGGICRVQHAKMDKMEFFVSPIGKPGKKALLEAVFNLPI